MTIEQAACALRARQVSAVELTREALARIERLNDRLHAFITVTGEQALVAAARADQELARGVDRGPLHGIPVALKDVFATRGVRTTCGSKIFADYVPDFDAAVTERLHAAGAVLLGKTNMHELAYGITSANPHYGAVRNPYDPDRVPGGSSGGSAVAVAAGMVFIAMGSDTGGSIRIPAAWCGVVGLKPTFGRVSRFGVLPLDFTLDHMGPLARSVRDAALALEALAGHDPRDETSSRQPVERYLPPEEPSLAGMRLGLPENFYFERIAPAAAEAVRKAARLAGEAGAAIVPVRVPDVAAMNQISRIILLAEAAAVMQPYFERREDFGEDVRLLLEQGMLLSATDYIQAQRLRRVMRDQYRRVWCDVDCLLTPTTPFPAPRLGQVDVVWNDGIEDLRLAATRLVRHLNLFGWPAISIPCGLDPAGLPLGLQIAGPPFSEARLLRVAAALEARLPKAGPPAL
ncbi:MAG: amidase [Bryobacterales bacterium]|nr:aspartyl/glutamyl-tRNA amidotransferase subunit A [Bryobacteraceae bacterium]MDW8129542.1 amidase [Bryobacterales bacterium]